MSKLRSLQFENLSAAVDDAHQLLASGYVRRGNWSLGQICRHLVLVQDPSIDGYPAWMSLFVPMRPLMRRWLLPKLLGPDSPRGIRTAPMFMPPDIRIYTHSLCKHAPLLPWIDLWVDTLAEVLKIVFAHVS